MKPISAWVSGVVVLVALVGGLGYIGVHIAQDMNNVVITSAWPYVLLGVALAIALGFEFVNGFHDTANAVATVIYTHSLDPNIAVVWSGLCNLTGVLMSTGAVAFSVITLLPVELILKVSYGAGFAMVFALLIAAILWNLSTWWLGLPASSSHTMVGSIIGVGIANQIMSASSGTSGVDWGQVGNVFRVLLISPVVGFCCAAILLLVLKPASRLYGSVGLALILALAAYYLFKWSPLWTAVFAIGVTAALAVGLSLIPTPEALFRAPEGTTPPPWPIRALLILTCSGVSYFHGSNDGQKGMGLIMLILIGTVPTAYALNHAVPTSGVQAFVTASQQADQVINKHVGPDAILGADARDEVTHFIATKTLQPDTMIALRELVNDLSYQIAQYPDYKAVPANQQTNVRNDMYVVSEAIRLMMKNHIGNFSPAEVTTLNTYKTQIDKATKFIPSWVKVAVALALGLGTMVGWKRIVVTVGEKIGKEHLTYAQGACAELVAMATIAAADNYGLPVSTTHVLSSGIAGTMAANKSGLQISTIRNIAMAWIFTLPAAALLSGGLYFLFRQLMS
ncbi:MAG TPA: inorganic phosphate transporter [Terracidiphilus sp.]|nr:inorganic phosphate transporter [Terracidiphilus sp.]